MLFEFSATLYVCMYIYLLLEEEERERERRFIGLKENVCHDDDAAATEREGRGVVVVVKERVFFLCIYMLKLCVSLCMLRGTRKAAPLVGWTTTCLLAYYNFVCYKAYSYSGERGII